MPPWAKKHETLPKRTKAERAGSVAQVVESLLANVKALSSNSNTTTKKKEKIPTPAWVIVITHVRLSCHYTIGDKYRLV
jgi:hypothetical protein